MEGEIKHDQHAHRFRLRYGMQIAYIDYIPAEGAINILHTYVPEELRGQGIAARLMTSVMEYAKEHHLKVIPTCPYTDTFLKRYPEYQVLIKS